LSRHVLILNSVSIAVGLRCPAATGGYWNMRSKQEIQG
jgi:hypothetical protein